MKKKYILICVLLIALSQSGLRSQSVTVKETVNSINALLKANPYVDNFLEITFFYYIEVTPDRKLVVTMEAEGSFKSVFRALISDLDYTYQQDFCKRSSNTISWNCKTEDLSKINKCVLVENIIPKTSEANYYHSNISIMFSNRNGICEELYKSLEKLFKEVSISE
jgi:hypothetical protein